MTRINGRTPEEHERFRAIHKLATQSGVDVASIEHQAWDDKYLFSVDSEDFAALIEARATLRQFVADVQAVADALPDTPRMLSAFTNAGAASEYMARYDVGQQLRAALAKVEGKTG